MLRQNKVSIHARAKLHINIQRENQMTGMFRTAISVFLSVVFVGIWLEQVRAAQGTITQTAGVDNTRMAAYRALAQMSFQAFQRGEKVDAAELARILERTWDRGEWHNSSEGSFCVANWSVCQPIDTSMDAFINPIMDCSQKASDPAAVQAAYNDFLAKLKKAD